MDAPRESTVGVPTGPPQPTALWHVLTGIWACLAAVMSTQLAPDLLLGTAVLAFGGMLGLIWSVMAARVLLNRDARRRLTGRAIASWAVCPATGLMFAALCASGLPAACRVKLSEPALDRLAAGLEALRTRVDRTTRAGLMFVDEAVVEERCILLRTDSGGFFTQYGLARSRDGSWPASDHYGMTTFRHLFGRWYTFCARE
jgi:hypothetical protein